MKLNLIEKRKAESYSGDSLTYELITLTLEQKKYILKEIFKLDGLNPVKIKIEYLRDNELQIDSFYGKILTDELLSKYDDNITFAKIKVTINSVKTSFTIDFKDNYIRIKSDYENGVDQNSLEKIIEHIIRNI